MSTLVVDCYCSAGGVGVALDALGIHHVGIDIDDYSDTYPGAFEQGDASDVEFVREVVSRHRAPGQSVVLWLSPPCQRYSPLTNVNAARYGWDDDEIARRYPSFEDLNVREVIAAVDHDAYILENVPRCDDLEDPARINGLAFGKPYRIERQFETDFTVPNALGSGRPTLTMSTRDDYNNTAYQRRELARAKGVPTEWSEQEVHSAIPPEYVRYLLYYCPAVDSVSLPETLQQRPLADYGGEQA